MKVTVNDYFDTIATFHNVYITLYPKHYKDFKVSDDIEVEKHRDIISLDDLKTKYGNYAIERVQLDKKHSNMYLLLYLPKEN